MWVILLPLAAAGGDWHRDASLVCSDCHTMHNSKSGLPMRYDDDPAGAPTLLRSADATAVCLACHGGDRTTAPNVRTPANADPPGGGFPSDLSDPFSQAHSLSTAPVTPPDGDTPVVMTCTTCHDPHGNDRYRNLRPSPSGTGRAAATPVVVNQVVVANGTNPELVYLGANVTYVSGLSRWCLDCHNLLVAQDWSTGQSGSHSWDRSIFSSWMADWASWAAEIPNRVPVQNPAGERSPHTADETTCISCHKAHGSPNYETMIYPDGASSDSLCVQCHNQ
jgi:predicted CXXCH cytochrome family protein